MFMVVEVPVIMLESLISMIYPSSIKNWKTKPSFLLFKFFGDVALDILNIHVDKICPVFFTMNYVKYFLEYKRTR